MAKKKPTFEEALRQLEEIAEQIEQGRIGLEESIVKYEQGMLLVRQCREILAGAERRIQMLHERPDGQLERADFTPPEGASADRPAADPPAAERPPSEGADLA
jgi:exodeoxyribonuclease VII small subunit